MSDTVTSAVNPCTNQRAEFLQSSINLAVQHHRLQLNLEDSIFPAHTYTHTRASANLSLALLLVFRHSLPHGSFKHLKRKEERKCSVLSPFGEKGKFCLHFEINVEAKRWRETPCRQQTYSQNASHLQSGSLRAHPT